MGDNKWAQLFGSEWAYVVKLGAAIHDPEAKKSFWEAVRDKKLRDEHYSIYDDFPRNGGATERAREECCREVLSRPRLDAEKAEVKEKRNPELVEFQNQLGEIIEIGGHIYPLCLWPRREGA